jgi:hypothetical protein
MAAAAEIHAWGPDAAAMAREWAADMLAEEIDLDQPGLHALQAFLVCAQGRPLTARLIDEGTLVIGLNRAAKPATAGRASA